MSEKEAFLLLRLKSIKRMLKRTEHADHLENSELKVIN